MSLDIKKYKKGKKIKFELDESGSPILDMGSIKQGSGRFAEAEIVEVGSHRLKCQYIFEGVRNDWLFQFSDYGKNGFPELLKIIKKKYRLIDHKTHYTTEEIIVEVDA